MADPRESPAAVPTITTTTHERPARVRLSDSPSALPGPTLHPTTTAMADPRPTHLPEQERERERDERTVLPATTSDPGHERSYSIRVPVPVPAAPAPRPMSQILPHPVTVLEPDARGMPLPSPYHTATTATNTTDSSTLAPAQPPAAATRVQSFLSDLKSLSSPSSAAGHGGPHAGSPRSRDMLSGTVVEDPQTRLAMRRGSQMQDDWTGGTRGIPFLQRQDTVAHRLNPSLDLARKRYLSCKTKAALMGRSLNVAIGLQIVIGALITGLAAITTGRGTSIMTSVLGAFSTIVGSFLARMRGSQEPDLSKARAKGYDQFIRTVEAYIIDFGDEPAREHQQHIADLRREFEELEGRMNAEQRGMGTSNV